MLAPLATPMAAAVAFDAALLGTIASFLTNLLDSPGARAASDSGTMIFAATALGAWCGGVFARDLQRLFKLIRRWPKPKIQSAGRTSLLI